MKPVSASTPNSTSSRRLPRFVADYLSMIVVLGVLIGFFACRSEHFLTSATFSSIANEVPPLTVIAVGMTFVLIVAGIDLSVGSVLALCGAVLGVALVSFHAPIWLAVSLCLLTGLLCGALNGIITVGWTIPSFIVTLGMLEIARGAAYLVTHSTTKYIGEAVEPFSAPISDLLRGSGFEPAPGFQFLFALSPAFFLAILVVVLGQLALSRTIFGRYAIAVGSNEEAAKLSGIRPGRVKLGVFALIGLLTGLGAVFYTSSLGSADPNAGVGLELSAIAAVVIGGTSLMGGRGSVVNSFFGVLIIAVLQAGLAQIGATDPTKRLITGLVIVIAVIVDVYRHRPAGQRFPLLKRIWRKG